MLDFYRFKHFQNYPNLMHVVSTKSSTLPYAFSLALHTGEDEKIIIQNRKNLANQLHTDEKLHFIVANQTHSDNIQHITTKDTKGWESIGDAIESCDALITNLPNVVLNILTADCVPILLYDKKNHAIAAIHAGWKGTKSNIAKKTVKRMQNIFGTNPSDIVAGIAPSIGRCCYEVGEDVAKHFFDMPHSYTQINNKYMLDLPYINKKQLLQAGLEEHNIEMSVCTACDTKRFFSYRKEKGCSGRFMSMIALKDKK
jgi:YfiH family protein